ncbi:hypothetical protein [Microbacterium sp. 179-I 3D4 NHS]|uniref:hypothetical protein n=1 Tax=Microbacterium sp. 179-I 3D4 NHS TaxID=3142381 RepID=UPI0039A01D96
MVAGAVGLSVLVGALGAAGVPATEARFTDAEHTTSSTFTALRLATSTITGCTVQNNGLGGFQSVTLSWTSPHPPAWVRLTLTQGATSAVVPAANISSSGPVGGLYSYTATLSITTLGALLANLLGGTTTLAVTNVHPGSSWVSPAVSRRLTIGALGLNSTCTV